MIIEENNWEPLQPEEVSELFKSLDINWWIAGGWAIDIFLGKKSREHLDIDVLILRKDQIIIHKHLNEWELYKTNQPGLKPWEKGEYLEIGVNSVWCKETSDSPWVLEIMFLDTIKDEWFFRCNPKIRLTLMEIGLQTKSGISFLKPEIQLLYKANKNPSAKDMQDFLNVVSLLENESLIWLKNALLQQYKENHSWIVKINTILKEKQ